MRRRALCQAWTLSRIHRLLRPLRTKVSALATALRKERHSRLLANLAVPTPTPTRVRPPLRRTYQTRKRKRGEEPGSEEDGQYLPKPVRVSKSKHKSNEKVERKWSPEIVERIGAVVDAFRVLADVVYDEQVETEGLGRNILSLRDMCVRAMAEDIEPSAVAAAGEESGSDDDGELVDATKIVDERFEEIPEHLRRAAIIPYALSMIRQHIDTISPLPQLWNHILAICLSSSASPSPANTSDILQVCSNLFLASLRQPRSNFRGLASVYRNVVGSGPDKISPELFCRTVLSGLAPPSCILEDDYDLPPNFLLQLHPVPDARANQSPVKTPARQTRSRTLPPTPPTHDPFSNLSDDPSGIIFPIRAVLARPVAHLVAELGPAQLLVFVEATAHALFRWIESDEMVAGSRLREHRADAPVSKASDVRSLAPRVCARIGDWTAMALADVWAWSPDVDLNLNALEKAALAVGRVVEALEHQAGSTSVWVDVGDPFCALSCVYLSRRWVGDEASKIAATLGLLPLTARNCNILAGTMASLEDSPLDGTPSLDPTISFTPALKACARTFAKAGCPHLEATLLQLVLNERTEVECEVEEMLEDAEARWDALKGAQRGGDKDGWRWTRNKWRWDEITNTWVERSKGTSGLEYVPRAKNTVKVGKKTNVIMVSSDTEVGQAMDGDEEDEDDVFAAIPATTKYAVPRRRQSSVRPAPRPRSRTNGTTYVSPDPDSDYSSPSASTKPRTRGRPSFLADNSESETETEGSEHEVSDTDTDADKSDFDWTQYNGRYHPHDRVSGARSRVTRPKESLPKSTTLVSKNQIGRGVAPSVRSALKPTRVVSAPLPITAPVRAPAPVKRPRVVVELPLPSKRSKAQSNPTKPRVLGNHNAPQRSNSFSKPRPPPPDRQVQSIEYITTSTLTRLCRQFSSMSSDDDRDCVDADADMEVDIGGTENENENETQPRMEMPSSDDMDLFQVVTPVPRRVKSI
ncbi:hypothetical protein FRC10_003969, partial [Ceratobasidium sp. 414]